MCLYSHCFVCLNWAMSIFVPFFLVQLRNIGWSIQHSMVQPYFDLLCKIYKAHCFIWIQCSRVWYFCNYMPMVLCRAQFCIRKACFFWYCSSANLLISLPLPDIGMVKLAVDCLSLFCSWIMEIEVIFFPFKKAQEMFRPFIVHIH